MKIKNMKTREQKDKAAKKGKQSLSSVTRRFRNFSISKIDLTPPLPTLIPILAQWWIWRPSHARTMPRQNVKRFINSQVLKWREYSWLNINAKLNLPTWIQRLTKQFVPAIMEGLTKDPTRKGGKCHHGWFLTSAWCWPLSRENVILFSLTGYVIFLNPLTNSTWIDE